NRKSENLRLYEFGKSYHKKSNKYEERKHLSLFITGKQQRENWNSIDKNAGFFFTKGIINSIFERLGLEITFSSAENNLFSEGLAIMRNHHNLGYFGVLKSDIRKKYDIDQEVLFVNIDWDLVLKIITKKPKLKLKPINKFPAIRRDFALLIDQEINFSQIEKIAFETEKKILEKVGLFDVYEGENLPENKKSYAVSFVFHDENKTLTDKRVD